MPKKTFIVTVEEDPNDYVNAWWLHANLMRGFGLNPPKSVRVEGVNPRHVASYRDPDLSDKWLKEAEWRANHDRSIRFMRRDAGLLIGRLVHEVRKLNKMMNR